MNPQQLRNKAPFSVEVADDFAVKVRPIIGTDIQRIQRAYELLSERSRRNRFWTNAVQMSEGLAEQLTDTNEQDHIGWIALDPEDDEFPGFGAASLWIEREDSSRAETSLTIADAWQRRGLGTLLFSLLWFEGWEMGVRQIYGIGRADNHEMHDWWTGLGGTVVATGSGLEMNFDLVSPEQYVRNISYNVHAQPRQVDFASWLQLWLDMVEME